jgi:serine/threonine-protein kinase
MATVYVARMSGAVGFARTVAIKRLHPHLAADPNFTTMFMDEARLAARIRHPNVIDTLDVVFEGGELFLVMDFVLGDTLARMIRQASQRGIQLPPPVVSSIVIGALEGLHAAHEATNEQGQPLGIVHRDISPQNILVARDGVARVLDFGVAKAAGRVQETEGGELKGKLAYMAPEQLTRQGIDRRCDVFAMGVVLWEALTSRRLFAGEDAASTLYAVMNEAITPPSRVVPHMNLPPALDAVVLRALERDGNRRFPNARAMAEALEQACPPAPTRHAGKWVDDLCGDAMKTRTDILRAIESAQPPASGQIPIPSDDLISGAARNSRPVQAAPESWRHLPSSGSGVTSASGSHVTVAAQMVPLNPPPAEQGGSMKVAILGGLFAAFAIIGGVLLFLAMHARSKAAHNPASAAAVTTPAVVVAAAPPPSTEPEPEPTPAVDTPAAEPVSSSASAAPAPTHHASPYTGPFKPAPATTPKPNANDCADPFTTDANGIKHPKVQCFKH